MTTRARPTAATTDETVEKYARDIQRLLRHIDPDRRLDERQCIHAFVRGLQPTIRPQMTNFLTCRDKVTFSDVVATAHQFERSQHTHLQAVAQPRQLIRSSRTSLVSSTDDSLGQFTKHVEQLMRPIVESVTQLTLAVQQRQSPEVCTRNHPPPTRRET